MKLIYTEHASARLAKRDLKQEWIERVVMSPARIEPDEEDLNLEHRLAAVPELANRVLRVLFLKPNRSALSRRISTVR